MNESAAFRGAGHGHGAPGRKAINDIRTTLEPLCGTEHSGDVSLVARKATYQLDCLKEMLDVPPQRHQAWSYFQPRVAEEFGE